MPRTRKNHPPSLKAKVAVEAIKAHKTTAQIAQIFGVPDAGRWMEEAGAGRFARRLRQRSRASAQGGRGRKGRALQTDRPTEGGVGLFKKKELTLSLEDRRLWIDPQHARLTIQQQCELLSLPRSTYYYQPRPESAENLRLMRRLDELYLECPFFGSRRMAVMLGVNRKRAPAAHGDYGNRSSLSETELELPGAGSRDLPI